MKKTFIMLFCMLIAGYVSAQLVNNGATIVVKPGATLYVESNIENETGSTITNEGTIEVQGNLTNEGTMTSTTDAKIIFSGSSDSDVTSGGAIMNDVDVNKTSADIVLQDEMSIDGELAFLADDNQILLGANDLNLGSDATISGESTLRYIVTSDAGMVEKSVTADGTFDFPIGDAANYTPVSMTYTGSAYTSANIRTKVNNVVHPNKPAESDDYISRYWDVVSTGITDYDNTLTGTYVSGDVTGTAADVKGAIYDGSEWNYDDNANAGMTVTASTTDMDIDFSGTNFFGKLDLKVFIQGAYSSGSGEMSTTLNTNNLIPLTSPYAADAVTVGSIPVDVTDWVLIELRDESTPSTVLSSHSAFLKKDGSILSTDGTAMVKMKDAGASSAIAAIHHRNHLPIRTDVALNTINPTLHDFTTGLGQAYDDAGITTNDAMIDLGSGVYGMFNGNENGNTSLNIIDLVGCKTGTNPSQANVYSTSDINLNGSANVIDLVLCKTATNPSKAAHL